METERLSEALKGAADLSVRYYAGLLKLSTDYLQSLATLVSAAGVGIAEPAAAAHAAQTAASGQTAATGQPAAAGQAAPPRPPLLLAGRAGEDATAAFLIENTLADRVMARVAVQGSGLAARALAQPEVVSLGPGEQCVVQLRVRVDGTIEPGRDHFGELSVPELASRSIPFVVRRLPDSAPAGEAGIA